MTFAQFEKTYGRRISNYARTIRSKFNLPHDLGDDLAQAARMGVLEALPSWCPNKAEAGRNPFNWCARAMQRHMMRVVKSARGYKPCSKQAMTNVFVEFETMAIAAPRFDIEANLDLVRALREDPRPASIVKFVALALSPQCGADLGRQYNVTRQAICTSAQRTRARLKVALGR